MNILLTGATGYVGKLILSELGHKWDIIGVSAHGDEIKGIIKCNLSDIKQVENLNQSIEPSIIIHAAGDKNLARCEENPEAAYLANVQTTINLIRQFPNARIIYISSDYVFSGDRGGYREDDPIGPVTTYGKTKASAELAGLTLSNNFYVLRLSALYDNNATFLNYLREMLIKGEQVNCFDDVFYSPTYYGEFLILLQKLVEGSELNRRIYHSCGQRISRFFFAKLFARTFGFDESLIRQSSRIGANAPYLFADISLDNVLTCEALDIPVGRHQEYLGFLELNR